MKDTLSFGLNLTLVGMAITFAVLALLAGLVALMRHSDDRWQRREQELETTLTRLPATLDSTTAVLIAASVATYLTGRYRIRSVRRLLPSEARGAAWSAQGRAVLLGSHVLIRKDKR